MKYHGIKAKSRLELFEPHILIFGDSECLMRQVVQ
jgi:hypothetical protein